MATPCTVTVYVPGARVLAPIRFTVDVGVPGVSGFVPNVTEVPGGTEVADKVIGFAKTPLYVAVIEPTIGFGAGHDEVTVAGALKLNPPGEPMIAVQIPRP